MIRRALLLLAAIAVTARADTGIYQRTEAFSDGPPKNWRYYHPNQGFGFFPTGSSGAGEAGGFFFPKTFTAYYADTVLNGTIGRGTPLSASGTIRLDEVSFNPSYGNTVYVAHFHKGNTDGTFVNILGMSLTGNGAGDILCAPIVQFSNGRAFLGNAIKLPIDSTPLDWSYTWNPTAGPFGLGTLTVTIGDATSAFALNRLSGSLDYTLDSFGLYQPAFVEPNSYSYFVFFIDRLNYTALVGPAPKISVNGPEKIRVASSSLTFKGTTNAVSTGNHMTAVRYRLIHDGKTHRYRTAAGTTRWSATITIPRGTSTIEFKAVSDNGRNTVRRRTITRTP
jgi:hypothetical protein